ncbi:hypothetical protein [Saccharothrix variisporea]|uniref:Putative chitinase n=1 Tax=Saccharothrix variisporea TaxID=543527 RepID=A0A495XIX8_9PSEU|nr:hypothetical protein [Saccharothrix variisporea]RKT74330.1 putative chitinase [Saccharothrix variisporea]
MSRFRRPVVAALAAVTAAALPAIAPPGASAETYLQEARIAVLHGDVLRVKEGGMDADWEDQESGVQRFQLDGNRVAVLKTDGSLLVKEGDLGPGWYTVDTDSVTDFQLRDGRIAYAEGQDLYITEGDLGGEVVHQDAVVAKFQIEGDRVGVLTPDGALLVKEGDLGPGWVTISDNDVTDFQLENDRIAYTEGDHLWAQEGELDAPSIDQETGVRGFQLEGDRVGVLKDDGSLLVKGGDLEPGWATISTGVTDFELDADRIGYVENGDLWAQEGGLDAASYVQEEDIAAFDLDGDRVAVIKDGALLVKEGDLGPGWYEAESDSATGVQLLAPIKSGRHVTLADLQEIYGYIGYPDVVEAGLDSLNQAMDDGDITTPARMAAFIATLRAESGLRYDRGEVDQSLGRWRGRGFIQISNDFNYQYITNYFGYDFMADPDAAATLEYSAPIARWYWTVARPRMNEWADNLDMGAVDGGIGYYYSPAEDARRCDYFKAALRYFNGGELPDADINCVRH